MALITSVAMKEIRNILRETYQKRRSTNGGYSQNAFARSLGVSPTALSQFLQGRRNLSVVNLKRVVTTLQLSPHYLAQPSRSNEFPAKRIDIETFSLIAEWYYLAILNLAEVDSISSAKQVAQRLGISAETAEAAIARLLELNFLKTKEGLYRRNHESLDTITGVPSESLRKHNREKMQLALSHLEHGALAERDMSSMTVCFDLKKMTKVHEEIVRFKRRVASFCGTPKSSEVYSLNVQFFPLSKNKVSAE